MKFAARRVSETLTSKFTPLSSNRKIQLSTLTTAGSEDSGSLRVGGLVELAEAPALKFGY